MASALVDEQKKEGEEEVCGPVTEGAGIEKQPQDKTKSVLDKNDKVESEYDTNQNAGNKLQKDYQCVEIDEVHPTIPTEPQQLTKPTAVNMMPQSTTVRLV